MEKDVQTTIKQRFNESVDALGYSSYKLADELGISQRSAYNYMKGTANPPEKVVKKFCEIHPEFSFNYIFKGVGMLSDGTVRELSKIELMYNEIITALKGQIEALKGKCASLEEQNQILKELSQK